MARKWLKFVALLILVIVVIGLVLWWRSEHLAQEPTPSQQSTVSKQTKDEAKKSDKKPDKPKAKNQSTNPYGLVAPIADFRARITKKSFGTYISPESSPVQPERFQGYHSGVDVEYQDVTSDVPVQAIASGTVVYSGWVSGYGGVEILHHKIDGKVHSVLYGHLRPSSLLAVGTKVSQNQKIGLLGTGYSHETDNERRHLHFAILAGDGTDLRGYASSKAGLSSWLNPLTFYPTDK